MNGAHLKSSRPRRRVRGLFMVAVMTMFLLGALFPLNGSAQTTTPDHVMTDANFLHSPADASPGNGITIVQGDTVDLGDCATEQTVKNTVAYTEKLLAEGYYVITEVSLDAGCDSNLSDYLDALDTIFVDVEKDGTNAPTYWRGIMVDEESGYGFSPAQLKAVNAHLEGLFFAISLLKGGYSELYTEDAVGEGDWTFNQYHSVVYGSEPAPQIYNTPFRNLVNQECENATVKFGKVCSNLVTSDPTGGYGNPFDASNSSDTNGVDGIPYETPYGLYYYNVFSPA